MTEKIILVKKDEIIENKIFIIRGQKVMLDFHLAEIYGYTTKAFNQQVKNNVDRFDGDFMFQLSKEEVIYLRSKNLTANINSKSRSLPYAFTESGIYMLMTVLKGELAIEQSKMLIRLFKGMKDYIVAGNNYVTYNDFNKTLLEINKDIKKIRDESSKNYVTKREFTRIINELTDSRIKKDYLFFNGEKIKAILAFQKIYSQACKTIDIIDDYISLKTLILLKDINRKVKITIYTDNVNHGLTKIEYDDFVREFKNLNISFKETNKLYHDRYIFIDYNTNKEIIYHSGSSSKDAGNKITTINVVNDNILYHPMIDNLVNNNELVLK